MLVQTVLFDGFDPLDVVAPYGVLGAGGMAAGRGTVRGARGTVPVLEGRPA